MMKKILPVSIFVLIFVLILLLGLQKMLGNNKSGGASSVTPTIFQGKQGSYFPSQNGKMTNQGERTGTQPFTSAEFQKKLPIIAPEFILDYSPRMQKYVVSLKTNATNIGSTDNSRSINAISTNSVNGSNNITNDANASQVAYTQWLAQNPSYINELQAPIVTEQTVEELHAALDYAEKNKLSPEQEFKKNTDTILSIINTLFAPIATPQTLTPLPSLTPTPNLSPIPSQTPSSGPSPTEKPQAGSGNGGYTYYAQCDGAYDDYLLPIQNGKNGEVCTECSAGCGPTTATMILASYINSSLTPPAVIEDMSKNGVSISCDGSGMWQLYTYMNKQGGIEVSSLLSFDNSKSEQVASVFKNYINDGWTWFALGNFRGGGHYFWVTDVTNDGNILAYDPYYGRGRSLPFDENQYYPYPTYFSAFAVRKTN